MNEDEAQEKLQDYIKAYQEEFETSSVADLSVDTPEIAQKARVELIKEIPGAVVQLKLLRDHAKSETVRFQVSKYIIDNGLGKGEVTVEDPMEKLLREFQLAAEQDANDT